MSNLAMADTQWVALNSGQFFKGADFSKRDPNLDVLIEIQNEQYRFPKILRELSGYQREWLNDDTISFLRHTATAMIVPMLPERFAQHVRLDLQDADFRRTPGDTTMASRIKRDAKTPTRANFVDVEGIRCFCLGAVPDFIIHNLRLAKNSEWMANGPEIVSVSDCRAVRHPKVSAHEKSQIARSAHRPLADVLRTIDQEDRFWFCAVPDGIEPAAGSVPFKHNAIPPMLAEHKVPMEQKALGALNQPAVPAPVAAELSAAQHLARAAVAVGGFLAVATIAAFHKTYAVLAQVPFRELYGKAATSTAVVGTRVDHVFRHALPKIKTSTVIWTVIAAFICFPGFFKDSFVVLGFFLASLVKTFSTAANRFNPAVVDFVSMQAVKIFCRIVALFADTLIAIQQAQYGQQMPVETRLFIQQIYNLTRGLEQC